MGDHEEIIVTVCNLIAVDRIKQNLVNNLIYGQITLKIPASIRLSKLSGDEPIQYLDGTVQSNKKLCT